MKTEINAIISKQGYKDLKNPNNKNRWKLSELLGGYIAKDQLNYEVTTFYHIEDIWQQVHLGDFMILFLDENEREHMQFIESKTCSTNKNTGYDMQFMDYRYFIKGTNFSKPYYQSTTEDKGWLVVNNANIFVTYNNSNDNLYIISNYGILKQNTINQLDNYFLNHKAKNIGDEVTLSEGLAIKKSYYDSKKDTVNALLRLDYDTIESLGGELFEFHINFNID